MKRIIHDTYERVFVAKSRNFLLSMGPQANYFRACGCPMFTSQQTSEMYPIHKIMRAAKIPLVPPDTKGLVFRVWYGKTSTVGLDISGGMKSTDDQGDLYLATDQPLVVNGHRLNFLRVSVANEGRPGWDIVQLCVQFDCEPELNFCREIQSMKRYRKKAETLFSTLPKELIGEIA